MGSRAFYKLQFTSYNPLNLPFFVYGTLKPGGSNYTRYLAGRTLEEIPARLAGGALYDYGPYPFLAVEPDLAHPAEPVHGMLMVVQPELYAAALVELDDLESYDAATHQGSYLRVTWRVQTSAGMVTAWVYIAGPAMLATIRAGALRKIEGGVWPI